MENAASRFGQRLAHTEKKYRDQALKKLTVYLTKKSEWSDLEWDKLWKALFYCMWMSDKRAVQEELSSNLAALVHKIPTPELALSFVHSFLRTMHREWHGIDGLRLDKFYSLIRKFVHESIALLRDNEWDHELVQTFVSMVSSEIVSQLPNGLRMHLSDLFLDETWKAAGASIETDSFLLLLEPFFTLLSSEYDKTVFKRVRELVFAPMLSDYKFGAQPTKDKKTKKKAAAATSGETDGETDGDDEDDDKVFEHVELAYVQHRIFTIASADDTAERNRSGLYDLYGKFFAVTKVDSLKAAQEEVDKPKAPLRKRSKKVVATEADKPAVAAAAAAVSAETPAKKKKNKKRKSAQVEAEDAAVIESPVVETPVVETPVAESKKNKKQKVAEKATAAAVEKPAPVVAETTEKKAKKAKKSVEDEPVKQPTKDEAAVSVKESKKDKKATKAEKAAVAVSMKEAKKDTKAEKVVVKESKKVTVVEDATPAKQQESKTTKDKKSKKEAKTEAAVASKTDESAVIAVSKKEKAKSAAIVKTEKEPEKPKKLVVIKSGIKFQRCGVCKGFGKGFLPAGKDLCAHCERTQKTQKKAAAVVAKKRKAFELAAEAAAAEAEAASAKKVTFGKNKALPHDLSVKRLKASAKKEATPKDEASIKGVLKASAIASSSAAKKESKKAAKGRMKAADFF